jgi:MYXO-CTERM domain-containing protein
MRTTSLALAVLAVSTTACSNAGSPPEQRETREQSIYYGSPDTTHQAVVAVSRNGAMCSGTIVAVSGTNGYVLTAAHCLVGSGTQTVPPSQVTVYVGNNYSSPTSTFQAAALKVHPLYDGDDGSANDFGMIRFTGATASTPVIPAMTPAQDTLAVGTQVDLVGYGRTETSYNNTVRRHVVKPIADLYSAWLVFDQAGTSGGTCQGDSGGPALTTSGTERVAGVTSFGTGMTCTEDGYHGRVSVVYNSFIKPFIDGTVGQISCEECQNAATAGKGVCIPVIETCQKSSACQSFITCISACTTVACQNQCIQTHAAGADLYFAITDCMCDACPSQCGSDPMCAKPQCGFELNDASCGACSDAKCCAQEQACADNATCTSCASTSNPSCDTNPLFIGWGECLTDHCATECNLATAPCGFTSSMPACQTCFEGQCCNEAKACAGNSTCVSCVTTSPKPAGCDTNALAQAFEGCIEDNCGTECGVGGSGGTGGTGGFGGGTGGTGGSAGAAGSVGGSAGTAGTGGGSAGEAGTGGAAGVAGTGGVGGDAGMAGGSGAPSVPGTPESQDDDGGCGCSTVGQAPSWANSWLLLLGALLGIRRRNRAPIG